MSDPINSAAFGTQLAAILANFKNGTTTQDQTALNISNLVDSWTVGATTPAQLGVKFSGVLATWDAMVQNQLLWSTIPATGGPHNDGTVDLVDYLGNVNTVPGLNKIIATAGTGGGGGGGTTGGGTSGGGTPTLGLTASILNGAAPGTVFGNFTTNITSPGLTLASYGGLALAITGPDGSGNYHLAAGQRPTDIMVKRSYEVDATAHINNAGVLSTLPRSFTVAVVDSGTATLTITRAGATPLPVTEFNAPRTVIDTLTASGGTPPYRWAVVTDGSPFETVKTSDTQAHLNATGWIDAKVQNSHVARVRVEDSLKAFGYLNIDISVTAWDIASVGAVLIDFANASTSGGTMTGVTAKQGATNFQMVVPSGAPAPVLSNLTGPDGISRPYITWADSSQVCLAAGPAYSGSSTALGPLFNKTGLAGPIGAIIAVTRAPVSGQGAFRNIVSAHNSAAGGGWQPNSFQGVTIGTNGAGFVQATSDVDQGTHSWTAGGAKIATDWQICSVLADGYACALEYGIAPVSDWNNFKPDWNGGGAVNNSFPKTNTLTCDTVTIGGGYAPSAGTDLAYAVLAPPGLTLSQRQAVYAWLARRFPVTGVTRPVRKVMSGMLQTLHTDHTGFIWNDLWSYEMGYQWQPIQSLNLEEGVYIDDSFPGISTVWKNKSVYHDPVKGALQLPLRRLDAGELADLPARAALNPSQVALAQPISHYTWRSSGIRTHNRFAQYLGFFEFQAQLPSGQGCWPCNWCFPDQQVGGPFEFDMGEQGGQMPTATTCTFHEDTGNPDYVNVNVDDCNAAPHFWAYDWFVNADGTHTVQRYFDRHAIGPPVIIQAVNARKCMTLLLDHTLGGMFGTSDQHTIDNAPHFFQSQSVDVWAYIDTDLGQPPLALKRPTMSGTRGAGNVITLGNATFDWAGTHDWFGVYTYDPTNGEVLRATSTGNDVWGNHPTSGPYPILTMPSIPDQAGWQGSTLIFEHANRNDFWSLNWIISRNYMDPGATPDIALSTTALPTASAGQVVAYFSPTVLGGTLAISSTDTSDTYRVGPDHRELIAGAHYAGGTLSVTHTPAHGGPVRTQTFAVTVAGSSGGGGGGTAGGFGGTFATNSQWTLSNGSLTATSIASGGDTALYGTAAVTNSGTYDYTFHVHIDTLTASQPFGVGVADPSSGNAMPGTNNVSCGLLWGGNVLYGTYTHGGSASSGLAQGNTVYVRVKNGYAYFSLNGTTWVGTGNSADPAAGTGGVSLAGFTTIKPVVFTNQPNQVVTATF